MTPFDNRLSEEADDLFSAARERLAYERLYNASLVFVERKRHFVVPLETGPFLNELFRARRPEMLKAAAALARLPPMEFLAGVLLAHRGDRRYPFADDQWPALVFGRLRVMRPSYVLVTAAMGIGELAAAGLRSDSGLPATRTFASNLAVSGRFIAVLGQGPIHLCARVATIDRVDGRFVASAPERLDVMNGGILPGYMGSIYGPGRS